MTRAHTPDEHRAARARLVRAASLAIVSTGFRKSSIAHLAREAGISKGGFYTYYPGKAELFHEVLLQAEVSLREEAGRAATLDVGAALPALIGCYFRMLANHPILRALSDPAELQWLIDNLPPGTMEEARRDDDRFFAALYRKMRRRGTVRPGVCSQFCSLPRAALALTQGRALVGEQDFEVFVAFQVDAWVRALRPDP